LMQSLISRRFLLWCSLLALLLFAAFMQYHLLVDYPPGIDPDAATYGLNALKPLRNGLIPFYDYNNGAAEPIFIYSASVSISIFGPTKLAMRFLSASFGLLGILMLYRLIMEAGRKDYDLGTRRTIALLSVSALAMSQPVAFLYHFGMRFSTADVFNLAAVWAWLYALRLRRPSIWILAGVLTGLSQYSYLSNRVLPLILLGVLLLNLPKQWWRDKNLWQGLALLSVTTVIVLSPQIIWYLRYPSTFLSRTGQLGIENNPMYAQLGLTGTVLDKFNKYWQALGSTWNGQYNQIKEPLLAPLFYYGFIMAIVVTVFSFRKRLPWVLLLGLGVMLLPDLLAGDRDWPHETRSIGVYPYAAAFAGLGLGGVLAWLRPWRRVQLLAQAGLVLAVVYSGASQSLEFFSMDGNYGKMYYFGNSWLQRSYAATGEMIASDSRAYLLPLDTYATPGIKFLSAKRVRLVESAVDANGNLRPALQDSSQPIRLFLARDPNGKPWAGDPTQWVIIVGDTLYTLPPVTAQAVLPLLPKQTDDTALHGQRSDTTTITGNYADLTLGQWPLPKQSEPSQVTQACFQPGMCLMGASYGQPSLQAGQPLDVTLFWQAKTPVRDNYILFVHLLDRNGNPVAGQDEFPLAEGYRTYEWQPNELILTHTALNIPGDAQPGPYKLEVGFYLGYDINPVNTISESGQVTGNRAYIENIKLSRPIVQIPANATPTQIDFGDEVSLASYRIDNLPDGTQPLRLTLWWRGLQPASVPWTEFFHLTPATDNTSLVGQLDHELTGGEYPPTIWDKDEVVEEQIEIQSGPLDAGKYDVWMGLYNPNTQERAPVLSGPGPTQDNRTRLLEFKVP
jgi:Dolichyl-phosphate-mannose-protein mannosyltransferase